MSSKKGPKVYVSTDGENYREVSANSILGKALNGTDEDVEKSIEIKGATLKDDFCNFLYDVVNGPLLGPGSFNGSAIIHNDMKNAFKKLHPHLAAICEEIPVEEIQNIDSIADFDDKLHKEGSLEHKVSHYFVSSFKSLSSGENESIVLIGSKRLSTGDFVELKSPKTLLHGNYQFINELRVAIDDCKHEVEEYMNGKAAPKFVQSEMEFEEQFAEEDR